jgi:hypothetical protein
MPVLKYPETGNFDAGMVKEEVHCLG